MVAENINALRPVSKEHSIKEVVLTLFVQQSLLELDKLNALCDAPFGFDQYEWLARKTVKFSEPDNLSAEVSVKTELPGRRVIRYEKGFPVEIIQAINEEDRYFISYHSLAYSRWQPFKERFFEVMHGIVQIETKANVVALSLHYIDEFEWRSVQPLPLESIFLANSLLTNDFFKSQNSDFSIALEKKVDEIDFFDRIGIKISKNQAGRSIRVSHNLTVPLNRPVQLERLVGADSAIYKQTLQIIHDYNKLTLKKLLTKPVLDLIKLT